MVTRMVSVGFLYFLPVVIRASLFSAVFVFQELISLWIVGGGGGGRSHSYLECTMSTSN